MADSTTPQRPAFLAPALAVGLYADALPVKKIPDLKRLSTLNMFRAHKRRLYAADFASQTIGKDEKGELYFSFVLDGQPDQALYLSATNIGQLAHETPEAFFIYSFAPVEEAKPMQVPRRERVDKPATEASVAQAVMSAKTRASVNVLNP